MLLINIERYFYIVHPLKYQRYFSASRAKLIVLANWVFVILFKCPVGLMSLDNITFSTDHQLCYLISPNLATGFPTFIVINMTACFLPLLMIIVIYVRILSFARSHARRMRKEFPDYGRHRGTVKRRIKGATTCFLLALSLLIAMLPTAIIYIMEIRGHKVSKYIIFIGHVAFSSSGIFDVVIYYLRNATFKKSMKQTLRSIFKCCYTEVR